MDQIKALNDSVGAGLFDIWQPTIKIFTALHLKNKDAILSIPRHEESYGPNPRQKLDIYLAPQRSADSPILIFLYGGGLVRGDKSTPEGLLYQNLGNFFAQRGITTIIPDYRRLNSPLGGEDAVYPSGGEDVSLAMKWLETFSEKGNGNIIMMGQSAGGIHLSTFLLAPQFLEQRRWLASGKHGLILRGAINFAVPVHFHNAVESRLEVVSRYFGSTDEVYSKCPYGLLEACEKTGKSNVEIFAPKLLLLLGEFDPVSEIKEPMHDFANLATKIWSSGVELRIVKGHNHISPVYGLTSGDIEGERWGEEVVDWIKDLTQ